MTPVYVPTLPDLETVPCPSCQGGVMPTSARYVGASTPFGTVVQVSPRLFNPEATVQAKDGSTRTYRRPFLIAHGLKVKA